MKYIIYKQNFSNSQVLKQHCFVQAHCNLLPNVCHEGLVGPPRGHFRVSWNRAVKTVSVVP